MANTAGKGNSQNKGKAQQPKTITKSKAQQPKSPSKSIEQQPKSPPKDEKLCTGIADTIKSEINKQAREWATTGLTWLFNFIETKVKDLPDAVKKLRNNPETEDAFAKMWAEQLIEKELIPDTYRGIADKTLIHNLHQQGYLDGMYVGFILSAMAMVDCGVSRDTIASVRDVVVPNMLGRSYEKWDEFASKINDEKYNWVLPKVPSREKQEGEKP